MTIHVNEAVNSIFANRFIQPENDSSSLEKGMGQRKGSEVRGWGGIFGEIRAGPDKPMNKVISGVI